MRVANFYDILVHVLLAALWGVFCGYAGHMGLSYGGPFGLLMAFLALLALFAGLLFWALRERAQHRRQWGGLQSQLEWVVPDVAMVVTFGLMFLWTPERW
jgi:hypothetical protein